ncbi:type II toxin-antitoxin system VapC family toxin [Asticcacaulis sp. 201]|uniref:type II toxin-antitoxin system VapC family toxin n=1 Tax=Asticcacaulis sp. 201 TaxID=3028787 RepID=UPI002915F132|nr:type II toxin-antitoxin system VapC family toxin [Asticcacaulis sp. 201]MDV6332835.1 type II toxin-antitoxin system VapC family toxin [Asticcacaulis sp. 201]
MYLLDTAVISELRKAKSGRCDANVMRWAAGVARQNLYMSAIGLLELENSVAKIERKDRGQGAPLRAWLDDQVMKAFEGRILAIDSAVVKKRAALPEFRSDRDALLAATAQVHGLTLVTRNVTVFKTTKIKLFNPWGYTPEEDVVGDDADWQQVAKTGSQWLKSLFLR